MLRRGRFGFGRLPDAAIRTSAFHYPIAGLAYRALDAGNAATGIAALGSLHCGLGQQ
jgi:hypothetical protein